MLSRVVQEIHHFKVSLFHSAGRKQRNVDRIGVNRDNQCRRDCSCRLAYWDNCGIISACRKKGIAQKNVLSIEPKSLGLNGLQSLEIYDRRGEKCGNIAWSQQWIYANSRDTH